MVFKSLRKSIIFGCMAGLAQAGFSSQSNPIDQTTSIPKGIENDNGTCFMNSAIQMLGSTRTYRAFRKLEKICSFVGPDGKDVQGGDPLAALNALLKCDEFLCAEGILSSHKIIVKELSDKINKDFPIPNENKSNTNIANVIFYRFLLGNKTTSYLDKIEEHIARDEKNYSLTSIILASLSSGKDASDGHAMTLVKGESDNWFLISNDSVQLIDRNPGLFNRADCIKKIETELEEWMKSKGVPADTIKDSLNNVIQNISTAIRDGEIWSIKDLSTEGIFASWLRTKGGLWYFWSESFGFLPAQNQTKNPLTAYIHTMNDIYTRSGNEYFPFMASYEINPEENY